MYKEKYGTFLEYLEKRWNYSESRGYQLINTAEFILKLSAENSTIVEKKHEVFPQNEAQTRPLIDKLSTD
ncbi:hypothetical protein [Crenothrix sp.]|uniref:hypothetical protein n=1 Tax=Crenothrix sp. TaxID=3100433 RepID=UPI00374D1C3C